MKREQKIKIISVCCGIIIGLSTIIWTNLDSLEILTISIAWACLWYAITNPLGKKIWASVGGIIGGYLILVGTFPLYNQWPEDTLFAQTKTIRYYIESSIPDNKIIFENENGSKTISTQSPKQELFFPESKTITLTLPLQKTNTSKLFIQTPLWIIYSMYPESTITIQGENITKIQGNISTGDGERLKEQYNLEKNTYIIRQLWWAFFTNPQIRAIQKDILWIAYKIHPSKYEQNLKNEKMFSKLLNRKEIVPIEYKDRSSEIQKNIRENIKNLIVSSKSIQ